MYAGQRSSVNRARCRAPSPTLAFPGAYRLPERRVSLGAISCQSFWFALTGGMASTFCVLPWLHLATHPQGQVSLCCRVEYDKAAGIARNWVDGAPEDYLNLNTHSLSEIMNSRTHRDSRLQMLRGERPHACNGCYRSEDLGIESKRQQENAAFAALTEAAARTRTDIDGSIAPNFEFIELRLGNLCNVKCRTCNPSSSSKWTSDYKKLRSELSFVRDQSHNGDFSWPESLKFWSDVERNSPHLKQIYINGGEPTLIAAHWDFLETLCASGRARHIALLYNINMTHLPQKAFAIWRQFKKVHISASIDDVGARNTYIRHPTEWEPVVEHLRRLKNSSVSVSILQTVSAMNFYYLDELYAFARAEGVVLSHNYVYDPKFMSVQALPQAVRLKRLIELKARLPDYLWHPLNATFSHPDQPELWQQFKIYTQSLDRLRGESFVETFPEFNAALNA